MIFHSIYPSHLRLPVLARVAFVAIGLLYACASLNGERIYSRAILYGAPSRETIARLELAARWFPLDFHYRRAAAEVLLLNRFPGALPLAIEVTERAIRDDPFAPDLRRNLASLLFENGEVEAGKQQVMIFHALAPYAAVELIVNTNINHR